MIERVDQTAAARADVAEAYAWYEDQEPGVGEAFLTALADQLRLIQQHPDLYPSAGRGCRRAPMQHYPYEVFYEVTPKAVVVHFVFHTSRDPRHWRTRLRQSRQD